ncbi:vacuolar protein sorting-associated protein 52 a [Phtheirospermum japonicum]|uniref:Vacuolar protein sorting-associated protein 52 a n=1 Tax=Phtheirospermum japonicum TaxID=374723 RepID=A0A830D788_9LAMI|nr:vacuolar protein sorting-associated protein 52 a [Phtheirospermum japonicum]
MSYEPQLVVVAVANQGVVVAIAAFFCFKCHTKRPQLDNSTSRRTANIPIRVNGADACTILSYSSLGTESPRSTIQNGMLLWLGGLKMANLGPASGIVEDMQKATCNFMTLIGQVAFGPVYKAQMVSGEMEIDESALIPHIAEASSKRYPYEVLFKSLHKLLMDTAASEYLFCDEFFGEQSMFYDIFASQNILKQLRYFRNGEGIRNLVFNVPATDVNISLWPRFKMVFDLHLNSLRNANVRTLWEDDVHPHYVMRRCAEFTASLIQLNVDYGDGQLELNLERLRMAIDDLLVKLAKLFQKPKSQTVAHKEIGVNLIRDAVEKYDSVYVFTFENTRNLKFKEFRDRLKSSSRVDDYDAYLVDVCGQISA